VSVSAKPEKARRTNSTEAAQPVCRGDLSVGEEKFRLTSRRERFGAITLGMRIRRVPLCRKGPRRHSRASTQSSLHTCVRQENAKGAPPACQRWAHKQEMIFRETDQKIPEFSGHQMQVYAQEFSGPPPTMLEKRGSDHEGERSGTSIAGRTSSASKRQAFVSRFRARLVRSVTPHRFTNATW